LDSTSSVHIEPNISSICTDEVESNDSITTLKAELNGEEWIPDSLISARLSENQLVIEAISKTLDGIYHKIKAELIDPQLGVNTIDRSTANQFVYETIENGNTVIDNAFCAYINLTKLDHTENLVSGTFQIDINGRLSDPVSIDITNGVFNDLTVTSLFCEPTYEQNSDEVDIFQNWKLLGIFDEDDQLVSNPPCHSLSTVAFEKFTVDEIERIEIRGNAVLNLYFADVFNLDEDSFSVLDFVITTKSGLPFEQFFEAQFIQVFANTEVTYIIEGNILTISNSTIRRKIKLALI